MLMMVTMRLFGGPQRFFDDLFAAHEVENKPDLCNGSEEIVKFFNQNFISCFGNPMFMRFAIVVISVYVNIVALNRRLICSNVWFVELRYFV